MNASKAKHIHYESGPNMTPLLDVVMVILIFLMLAGSFGSAEHYMIGSADLHAAGPSSTPNPNDVQPVLMDVYVAENGDVQLAWETSPMRVKSDQGPRPFSQRLSEAIGKKYQEVVQSPGVQSRQAKDPEDEVELIIHASDKVSWDLLAPVYDATLQAKVKKIGFRSSSKEERRDRVLPPSPGIPGEGRGGSYENADVLIPHAERMHFKIQHSAFVLQHLPPNPLPGVPEEGTRSHCRQRLRPVRLQALE